MRTRSTVITGILFLFVAGLLAYSQASAGGQRFLVGLLLATPWAVSGAAIIGWQRIGAWLGVIVAAASVVVAVWIGMLANAGEGRAIAEQLFASPEGYFSWGGVFFTTVAFGLAFVAAFGLSLSLLLDGMRKRPRFPVTGPRPR